MLMRRCADLIRPSHSSEREGTRVVRSTGAFRRRAPPEGGTTNGNNMRIAIGQLWQETNTFNPLPTARQDFEDFGVVRGSEIIRRFHDTNELGGFIQSLGRWPERPEIVGLVRLPAWPSGRATPETFRWLRDELV